MIKKENRIPDVLRPYLYRPDIITDMDTLMISYDKRKDFEMFCLLLGCKITPRVQESDDINWGSDGHILYENTTVAVMPRYKTAFRWKVYVPMIRRILKAEEKWHES